MNRNFWKNDSDQDQFHKTPGINVASQAQPETKLIAGYAREEQPTLQSLVSDQRQLLSETGNRCH